MLLYTRVKVPSVLPFNNNARLFFSSNFGFLFRVLFSKKKEAKGETDFDGSRDDGGEEGEEDGWADAESDV